MVEDLCFCSELLRRQKLILIFNRTRSDDFNIQNVPVPVMMLFVFYVLYKTNVTVDVTRHIFWTD